MMMKMIMMMKVMVIPIINSVDELPVILTACPGLRF